MTKLASGLGLVLPDYARPDLAVQQLLPVGNGGPAVGLKLHTVPGQYAEVLVSLAVQFVADATAADRILSLRVLDDTPDLIVEVPAPTTVPANGITTLAFLTAASASYSVGAFGANVPQVVAWPSFVALPGWQFILDVKNNGAGDSWVHPVMVVERIPTGPSDSYESIVAPTPVLL